MPTYEGLFSSGIGAVYDALKDNDNFEIVVLGDVNKQYVDYPCIYVLPQNTPYQEGHEYQTNVEINYIFRRDPNSRTSKFLDYHEIVEGTLDDVMSELEKNSSIHEWKLTNQDYGAGEWDGTNVIVFTAEFRIKQFAT